MSDYKRTDRIGDEIQKELSMLIQREMKDPRIGMVTIPAVEVSRDLAHAVVFCTFLGIDEDDKSITQALKVLDGAQGFLRTQLAKRIRIRTVPKLRFKYDKSLVRGRQLSSLIEEARSRDKQLGSDSEESEN